MDVERDNWGRYTLAWAGQHGGYDLRRAPGPVRGWARLAYATGRLAVGARVRPGVVTLAGLVVAWAVPVAAGTGPAGPLVGSGLVLLSAFLAGVDKAIGLLTARRSWRRAIRESVGGRLGEVAWLAGFWAVGVPGPLLVACGTLTGLHEYVRIQALSGGMSPIGAQTVGERVMRVWVAVVGLALAWLAGADLAAGVLTIVAAGWLLLAVLGFGQLLDAVRRSLR